MEQAYEFKDINLRIKFTRQHLEAEAKRYGVTVSKLIAGFEPWVEIVDETPKR